MQKLGIAVNNNNSHEKEVSQAEKGTSDSTLDDLEPMYAKVGDIEQQLNNKFDYYSLRVRSLF